MDGAEKSLFLYTVKILFVSPQRWVIMDYETQFFFSCLSKLYHHALSLPKNNSIFSFPVPVQQKSVYLCLCDWQFMRENIIMFK